MPPNLPNRPDLPPQASKQAFAVQLALKLGINPAQARELARVTDDAATGEDITQSLVTWQRQLRRSTGNT